MKKNIIITIIFLNALNLCLAQPITYTVLDSIPLKDNSFEIDSIKGSHWIDLGFKNYTPPDIHNIDEVIHRVQIKAQEGNSFLGMVTRQNETYEQIGQLLERPLIKGKKYLIKLFSCFDPGHKAINSLGKLSPFDKPIELRIFAYHTRNKEPSIDSLENYSLFLKSDAIDNLEWKELQFILEPTFDSNLIVIQAFFNVPVIFPYNGHILIDNISSIYEIE